jgi:beta-lactamase class A
MELGRRQKLVVGAAGCALFLVGASAGFLLRGPSYSSRTVEANRQGGYAFVNPLLTCDLAEDQPYSGFDGLQRSLGAEVDSLKSKNAVTRVSVYFRDMNFGTWTGVNADDTFIPASLMKVPLLFAYLKMSQQSPALLDQTYSISANASADSGEFFKPLQPLAPGTYTVNQLLQAMIAGSDNNAKDILMAHVSTTSIDDVYSTLDIPTGDEDSEDMSPKDYMVLFRVLYNATYLGRTRSQQALELLSKADFKDGIVAGTGAQTVAHKFGERSVYLQDSSGALTLQKRELHDCGIVYYPGSPYGLCVMTEGSDFTAMAAAIADISSLVYAQVQNGLLERR